MRTDSENRNSFDEPSRFQMILEILFQGRQKVIQQFLDRIREYIKNSFPMTVYNYIADCYETCRGMFGNYHLVMHDPVRLSEMSADEQVEDTTAIFSDILESLRRVEQSEEKKTSDVGNDFEKDYATILEREFQKMLEEIENRPQSIRLPEGSPAPVGMKNNQPGIDGFPLCDNSIALTSMKPASVEELREKTPSDQDEEDERLAQEELQKKLAELTQRYQEKSNEIKQRKIQQH